MALKLSVQKSVEESEDIEIEFYLKDNRDHISICAKNKKTEKTFTIATISPDGKLYLNRYIPKDFGLPTDLNGRIILREN